MHRDRQLQQRSCNGSVSANRLIASRPSFIVRPASGTESYAWNFVSDLWLHLGGNERIEVRIWVRRESPESKPPTIFHAIQRNALQPAPSRRRRRLSCCRRGSSC